MRAIITLSFTFVFAFFITNLKGQSVVTKTPNSSPKAIVGQTIGIADVLITYHRPAVKEREIWGKLVPINVVWRAGANDNTMISLSKDVLIEGKELAAGTYGLHILPTEKGASLIFSKNSTSWGSFSYDEKEDALRVNIQPTKTKKHYEYLTYEFEDLDTKSATCALKWENKSFPFTITTNTDEMVLAQFRKDLRNRAGWTWRGYNEAANYCLKNDINHKEALGWATRSVFMTANAQNLLTKAQLAAKLKAEGGGTQETEMILSSLESDLETFPVTWKEYNAAANFAVKKEKYDKAIDWSKKAVEMSANMTSMMTQSQIYAKRGNEKIADKIKQEAIAKGSNAELNTYGYQLLFSGKGKESVEIFKANTEKNPTDPNVWDSLGECYFNIGEKEKAIEALKKSLSLNPPLGVKANSMKLLRQMGVEMNKNDIKP